MLFFLIITGAYSQDTITLQIFSKTDSVQHPGNSSFHYTIDTSVVNTLGGSVNLTELLSVQSSVYFRQNGPGMLATPSWRGGDASHTLVMWNGAKLNDPMNGNVDFSAISSKCFSSVDVFGPNAANVYTSGGLGGGIALINDGSLLKHSKARASTSLGSFGNTGLSMVSSMPYAKSKAALKISADLSQSKNKFSFFDITAPSPFPLKIMEHANYSRFNLMGSSSNILSAKFSLQSQIWFSLVSRELPQSINVSRAPSQYQSDNVLRAQSILKYFANNGFKTSINITGEISSNRFADTLSKIYNNNKFGNVQAIQNNEWSFKKGWTLMTSEVLSFTNAQSENYNRSHQVLSVSGLGRIKYSMDKRLHIEAGTRTEHMLKWHGLGPFLGLDFKPIRKIPIVLYTSINRTFRLPTLNELYWSPGGNVSLKPEYGYSAEFGFRMEKETQSLIFNTYYGAYKNRIRWLPQGQLFSPVNIYKSKSSGFDLSYSHAFHLRKWKIMPTANVSYLNAASQFEGDSVWYALSNAAPYNANTGIQIKHLRFSIYYVHQFISQRFITNDESAYMPAYHVGNVFFNYALAKSVEMTFQIWNVWNMPYQSIAWKPMPGRCFNLILNYRAG